MSLFQINKQPMAKKKKKKKKKISFIVSVPWSIPYPFPKIIPPRLGSRLRLLTGQEKWKVGAWQIGVTYSK